MNVLACVRYGELWVEPEPSLGPSCTHMFLPLLNIGVIKQLAGFQGITGENDMCAQTHVVRIIVFSDHSECIL